MSDTVRKVMLQETPEGHTYSDILFDPKIFKVEDDEGTKDVSFAALLLGFTQNVLETGIDTLQRIRLDQERAITKVQWMYQITFAVAAGEELPFDDASFDVAVGKAVLHHLDPIAGARELARILRPGGRAAFSEPLGTNPLVRIARDHVPYPGKHERGADIPLRRSDVDAWMAPFSEAHIRGVQLLSMVERGLGFGRRVEFERTARFADGRSRHVLGGLEVLRIDPDVAVSLHAGGAAGPEVLLREEGRDPRARRRTAAAGVRPSRSTEDWQATARRTSADS